MHICLRRPWDQGCHYGTKVLAISWCFLTWQHRSSLDEVFNLHSDAFLKANTATFSSFRKKLDNKRRKLQSSRKEEVCCQSQKRKAEEEKQVWKLKHWLLNLTFMSALKKDVVLAYLMKIFNLKFVFVDRCRRRPQKARTRFPPDFFCICLWVTLNGCGRPPKKFNDNIIFGAHFIFLGRNRNRRRVK